MRIEVTARHMPLTDAMQEHAQKRCSKLTKFFDGVQEFECVLTQTSDNGGPYEVEILGDVVGHKNFVAKVKGEDVYSCIDEAAEKMSRQLRDYKEQLRKH